MLIAFYFIGQCFKIDYSECCGYRIPDWLAYNKYTTCRDIYVGVTCGQLAMRSLLNMFHPYPCPHTFFTSQSSLHSLKFLKIFYCAFWLAMYGHVLPVVKMRLELSNKINVACYLTKVYRDVLIFQAIIIMCLKC